MAGKPGRSGRPAKPLEQHAKHGTRSKATGGRGVGLVPVPDVEPATVAGWLDNPTDVVGRVLGNGVDWLAVTDEPMLAQLRVALGIQERAMTAGSIRDQLEAQKNVVSILSMLGFDPAARARLGLAKVATVSKLEKLRQQAKGS